MHDGSTRNFDVILVYFTTMNMYFLQKNGYEHQILPDNYVMTMTKIKEEKIYFCDHMSQNFRESSRLQCGLDCTKFTWMCR